MSWLALGACLAACNQYLVVLLPENWHHFLSNYHNKTNSKAMVAMKQIFVCVTISMAKRLE